jgi:hypothetical protein
MLKTAISCIWLVCLMSLVSCIGSSQGNVANMCANLILTNNADDVDMNWDVVRGFTLDPVHVSPGHPKTIRIKAGPFPYTISRNDTALTICYRINCITIPCKKQILLMMDNKPIEIGSTFAKDIKSGSTHTIDVSE